MLKGYIIEKYNEMKGAYTCSRLVEEARACNIALDIIGVHDTFVNGKTPENKGRILEPRDFVINRYKWGHIKDEMNGLAQNSYNKLDLFKLYLDKYAQIKQIESKKFSKPVYLLGTSKSDYNILSSRLGTPFIAKGLKSSMGREIRLIKCPSDFKSLAKEFSTEKEFLFEEFISNSYGRDLRLFCISGKAVACMIRESQNDFRANVALGAKVVNYPINSNLQKIASDIYDQTSLDFIGIDLLFGSDCLYFCEINVMPGLEGIEQATGINIARLVVNRIKEDFN